eukprot:330125_1
MITLRLLKPNNLIPIRFCLMSFSIQSGSRSKDSTALYDPEYWRLAACLASYFVEHNPITHYIQKIIQHCQPHPTQQLQKNDDPDDVYDPMQDAAHETWVEQRDQILQMCGKERSRNDHGDCGGLNAVQNDTQYHTRDHMIVSAAIHDHMHKWTVDAATFVPKSSKMRLKPVKEEDYGPDADGKVRISYRLSADFHHKCVESRGVGCCIDKEGKCKGCFEYMKQYCAMQHNDGQLSRDAIQTKNGSLITFVNWSRHCYVTKEDLYGVIVENRSDKWQRYRWLLKENTTASQIVNTYHDTVYAWHLPISPLEMNWFTLQNAVSIIRMRFRSLKELNHSLAA